VAILLTTAATIIGGHLLIARARKTRRSNSTATRTTSVSASLALAAWSAPPHKSTSPRSPRRYSKTQVALLDRDKQPPARLCLSRAAVPDAVEPWMVGHEMDVARVAHDRGHL
jgi:hypothetical protein